MLGVEEGRQGRAVLGRAGLGRAHAVGFVVRPKTGM